MPRPACPRCGVEGIVNHDTLFCWNHGTFEEPARAWDLCGDIPAETYEGKSRRKPAVAATQIPWRKEELEAWATWRDGDPVPGWITGEHTPSDKVVSRTCPKCGRVCETNTSWGGHHAWHTWKEKKEVQP